ncbi:oxidoreductase [Campylobacter devanensis]|uniref:oxidoreductase n=1 Tax=Campylobacter devanensis TaxID=3161138 RepID=UPI000A33B2C2|nr:oxidoreductase [Campylobacter sp. P0088]
MLKDKVVIIIGGSGLIGKAFVKSAIQNHATVINADINQPNTKLDCEFIHTDITNKSSLDNLIELTSQKYGKIDAVVNSAYPRTKSFSNHFFDVEYEDFCTNTNLQLGGAFLVMQRFAKFFKSQGYGNIITLSSIQGVVAPKFQTYKNTQMSSPVAYSAIKSGVIHLSRYLAKYLKGNNIRVNCISPGGILDNQNEIFLSQYKDVCLNKGMLDPDDICGALIFLLSDYSQFINGQNIIVDDGFCL